MGRVIENWKPVPKDDPMFTQPARLVGINKFKRSTSDTEKSTAGETQTHTPTEPKEEK
jgi:hypothetical protein